VKSPDPAAVIRAHAAFTFRVLKHLGVAEQQLDDMSQEVFVIVLRQLADFEGRSSLRTWIFGICRNVARRARLEGRLLSDLETAQLAEAFEPARQDHELWLKQAHAQLLAALSQLDEEQRSVFVMFELEELPMEEIAAALAAPLTTCYSRLYAARKRVEAAMRRRQQRTDLRLIKGVSR
jgi:RNA polymerase sigma-70 factor (ECF subfamily)